MRNQTLAADHVRRATIRLRALDVLYDAQSWADVVGESQEVRKFPLPRISFFPVFPIFPGEWQRVSTSHACLTVKRAPT